MLKRSHTTLVAAAWLMLSASASAQNAQTTPVAISKPQTHVIASASRQSLRFSSLGEMVQLRLEIIGPAGDVLFDSELKARNAVDWSGMSGQGQRVPDGSYLCIVTVKGPDGDVTKAEAIAVMRDQNVSLRKMDNSLLSSAQVEAASSLTAEDVSLTIVEPEESAATAVLAHDGTTTHLVSGSGGLSISSGDFFSNKLLEHLRMTAEGNIGIGLSQPQVRLDVNGRIRASEGIVFPDGSVQFSASRKTFGAASLKPGQSLSAHIKNSPVLPDISGTGTTGKIPKWQDGPNGILNDSNITEVSGAIGVNGTPDTRFRLDVNGSTRIRGSNPGFNLEGLRAAGNIWVFQTVDDDGRFRLFGQDNVNPGVERLTIRLSNGNVGIGTTAPVSRLDVVNPGSQIHFGDTSADSGGFLSSVSSSQASFAGGASFDGTFWTAKSTAASLVVNVLGTIRFFTNGGLTPGSIFQPTEHMRITNAGNVGIGTTTPTARLDVNGDVSVNGAITVAPQTRHFSIHATGVALVKGAQYGGDGSNFFVQNNGSIIDPMQAAATITLPDGAVITRMRARVEDTDGDITKGIRVQLKRLKLASGFGVDAMADVSSGFNGDQVITTTSISNATIDNAIFSYFIEVSGPANGFSVYKFLMVSLDYTVTTPLP